MKCQCQSMVSTTLLARSKFLEAENGRLKASISKPQVQFYKGKQIVLKPAQ